MAVQPNRHALDVLLDTLVNGDRTIVEKKIYKMRQDHLDLLDNLRGSRTRVGMLRAILDDWRNMKIEQLREELEDLEAVA